MRVTRKSAPSLTVALVVAAAGVWLWVHYARAWELGSSSPVLSYDAAQYAVAAREIADHGRFATIYALPLELSRHPAPPWPLALVQPGLTLVEATLFRLAGPRPPPAIEDRDALALVLPALCYLAIGIALALGAMALIARAAPGFSDWARGAAGLVVGLAFLLDPEAQHFAVGGFTELPFTIGLVLALLVLSLGWGTRHPFAFGLLLGVTGAFRANMLWLAPILAACAARAAEPGARWPAFARVLAGYAVPMAPWWIYKWRTFGTPSWDLSWISLWDGVGGRTWFSLNHLPELPALPSGMLAFRAIAIKMAGNVPHLLLEMARGPRALWLGALAIALVMGRRAGDPALRAGGLATLAALAISVIATAASVPITRYLFPARIVAEAAGLLALGGLIARAPDALLGRAARTIVLIGVSALAVLWGAFRTGDGWQAAASTAEARGVPSLAGMRDLAARVDRELAPGEPLMSNLGPILAWHARRPVVHMALSPADLDACRRRLNLRAVLLVFREPRRAWPEWQEVMERPDEAAHRPEWNVSRAVRFETADGFVGVWLELGPLGAPVASAGEAAAPRGRHAAAAQPSRPVASGAALTE